MSRIADLYLDNESIERIDIDDCDYNIDFLKEMALKRRIRCGGHNSQGETCGACLTIKKKPYSSSKYIFSKLPSSEVGHIHNCSRQNVNESIVTRSSIKKYQEFVEKLICGVYETDDNRGGYVEVDNGNDDLIHFRRKSKSLNLKKLANLVNAIYSDNNLLQLQVTRDIRLFQCFKYFVSLENLKKFISSHEDRYYYIFFDSAIVTSSGNFKVKLKKQKIENGRNIRGSIFVNTSLDDLNNDLEYTILIVAKNSEIQAVLHSKNNQYYNFEDYKITIPNYRIFKSAKRNDSLNSLQEIINLIRDLRR